ncbi:hypothetical protein GCM10009735_23990 [Actinomadura chokoriensis]
MTLLVRGRYTGSPRRRPMSTAIGPGKGQKPQCHRGRHHTLRCKSRHRDPYPTAEALTQTHDPNPPRANPCHHRQVRYTRVIPPVALLAALSACTQHTPSFNPTPHPTRPGQVVIIAGAPDNFASPRDGEYAIKSSAESDGGLAVDPDSGLIYLRALSGGDKIIERIERDGTITTLHPKHTGDQLAISRGALWTMSSYEGVRLSRVSLTTLAETEVLDTIGERPVQVLDFAGDPTSTCAGQELREFRPDSRLAYVVTVCRSSPRTPGISSRSSMTARYANGSPRGMRRPCASSAVRRAWSPWTWPRTGNAA